MAATTSFVSVEQYLRSSFDPDAEYFDGQIEKRAAGENDHSAWQASICSSRRLSRETTNLLRAKSERLPHRRCLFVGEGFDRVLAGGHPRRIESPNHRAQEGNANAARNPYSRDLEVLHGEKMLHCELH